MLKRYLQLLPLLKIRETRGLIMSLVILSYIHLAPGIMSDTEALRNKITVLTIMVKSENMSEVHHEGSKPNGK